MDFLNSILDSMDKPPVNEQQNKLLRKQREMAEQMRKKQKEELLRFRKYVEERVERFAKDNRSCIEFQPLDKVHRSVIHEVAEFGGFLAMSFGREDIDRYSVVYKKENAPSEDEITARRNGDDWNIEIAKEYANRRKIQRELEMEQKKYSNICNESTVSDIRPTTNYKDKYAHLIGQDAALEAARKTETNKNYGFVPSKNKKDLRSIEQTLADIQAKKRRRLEQNEQNSNRQEVKIEENKQSNTKA